MVQNKLIDVLKENKIDILNCKEILIVNIIKMLSGFELNTYTWTIKVKEIENK